MFNNKLIKYNSTITMYNTTKSEKIISTMYKTTKSENTIYVLILR